MCITIYVYVRMYVCMHACMHACMHVCMYVCMYVFMYMCIQVYMYTCVYIYIYTHVFTNCRYSLSGTALVRHMKSISLFIVCHVCSASLVLLSYIIVMLNTSHLTIKHIIYHLLQ